MNSCYSQLGIHNPHNEWDSDHKDLQQTQLCRAVVDPDISTITYGGLPWKISNAHNVSLGITLLVQIEDIINIGASNPRAVTDACVLQAVLNDGAQEFIALEHRRVRQKLSMNTLAGTKLVLFADARVRRGRLLLTPDNFRVLGSPRTDIWGTELGQMRRADALRHIGLPVPSASTFDAIAAKGTVVPMGLADASITEEDSEKVHDDDEV